MSLAQIYAAQFRNHLNQQPVWQPGSAIAPGDFGIMADGVFARQGHLSQFSKVPIELVETPIPSDSKFSVGVTLKLDAAVSATVDPSVVVGATLTIDRKGGMAYHANGLVKRTINNLRAVLDAVPWDRDDWATTVFVAEVTAASSVALVLTEDNGADIKVTGKAGPLQMLSLADASIGLGLSSNANLTLALPDPAAAAAPGLYPVAMTLYGHRRTWWGTTKVEPLESVAEAEAPPFVELAPAEDGSRLRTPG